MAAVRRHRHPYAAIAAAIAVHVIVLVPGQAFGLLSLGEVPHHARAVRPDEIDVVTTCAGDLGLGASARFALCLAPWSGDVDACFADARTRMWMDLSACSATTDPGVAVAMLDPVAIEKLAPIDAEKLLEEQPVPPELLAVLPPPPPPPPLAAPPPPPPEQRRQVVETVKPKVEEAPTNARLLAEYNTKVEKQTVARGSTKEPLAVKSKPDELAVKDKPKDEPPATEKPVEAPKGKDLRAPDAPGLLSMRNPGAPTPADQPQDPRTKGSPTGGRAPSMLDGFMPRRGDGALEQEHRERQEIPRGGSSGGGGGAPPDLKPSKEMLERIAGGGNVDHLDDVANGDDNALNAQRFVFASFLNRVKRQVAQNWAPQGVHHAVDPEGKVYGYKSRLTELRVALKPGGAIERIVVTEPCGIGVLDDEAVRAMKAAGPFPNVPGGMVGADGLASFSFSFYFQIGEPSHTSWRMPKSL